MDGSAPKLPLDLADGSPQSFAAHTGATIRLAAPLAAAQLAQMAMGVTDTILLGALGPEALAAGGLAASVMMTVMTVLQGALAAVSILAAQARGARNDAGLPAIYWTGALLAAALVLPAFALYTATGPLLLALGESASLATGVQRYLDILRWSAPGALLGMGLARAFLPTIGGGPLLLWVTAAEAIVNAPLCYALIHGAWGFPQMGLEGAALATTIVLTVGSVILLALLHLRFPRFVAPARPTRHILAALLRLGIPIAATYAVETCLFLAVALLIGLLGPAALAAQQVALSVTATAFMVAIGIAQAANVRVGHATGAHDPAAARTAGLAAIALVLAYETIAALILLLFPGHIAALYLSPSNTEAFATATTLIGIAALFQLVDGLQCVAAGALRGLGDTRIPFILAATGYWAIGFPAAWVLTLPAGLGAPGAWWGLAAALAVVAALLTARFLTRSRTAIRSL